MVCEKLKTCPFFKKYKEDLAPTDYELMIENYCKGPLTHQCARLNYEKEHGQKPPDDLSPIGEYIK
jgi:hypothetical protein